MCLMHAVLFSKTAAYAPSPPAPTPPPPLIAPPPSDQITTIVSLPGSPEGRWSLVGLTSRNDDPRWDLFAQLQSDVPFSEHDVMIHGGKTFVWRNYGWRGDGGSAPKTPSSWDSATWLNLHQPRTITLLGTPRPISMDWKLIYAADVGKFSYLPHLLAHVPSIPLVCLTFSSGENNGFHPNDFIFDGVRTRYLADSSTGNTFAGRS